ncbi:alanine racemase [Asticcacaulis biprosthecium C19]|uniref:Alanine racemase n=1 Tax=Asticcacaulis biprosthecium C19 TaxID=715226 RepID=F4QRF1_9CAUL|nr:alanine racemase [Asticcacaulis biprosthecium]EGF90788.1 alanine racemase [Asticcacaulis biprosthecium C19]
MSASSTARLNVDLAALSQNYASLKRAAGAAEVAPVVKADAYGLGMAGVAAHLARQGAKTFFVARLAEGLALRTLVGNDPVIYVLDGLTDPSAFAAQRLRPVINTPDQYQLWLQGPSEVVAALHIDTGMNRLGVRPDQIADLPAARHHGLALVMSHLACGDEPGHPMNYQQLMAFRAATDHFPGVARSLSNSSGLYLGPDYGFDLVRPGICLYGGGPFGTAHADIQPVAHLSARILQIRELKVGESVGYGASFVADRDMTLATIGLGYADGLMRSLAPLGFVTVQGERRPLTGRVSMDVFTVDVTGLHVSDRTWVEILGSSQNLDAVATAAGTIGYEVLTRLGTRVPRHYT